MEVDLTVLTFDQARQRFEWCVEQGFVNPREKLMNYQNDGQYTLWNDLFKFTLTEEESVLFLLRWA